MLKLEYAKEAPKNANIALVRTTEGKDSAVFVYEGGQKEIQVGIGKKKEFTKRKLFLLPRQIISLAKANKIKRLAINFDEVRDLLPREKEEELGEAFAANLELANFEFVKYKTKPEEGWDFIEEVTFFGKITAAIKRGAEIGQLIGEETNACRSLANTPGGEMTPSLLAKEAEKAAEGTKIHPHTNSQLGNQATKSLRIGVGVKVETLGAQEMKKLKMGGMLGVAKGSKEEPKFIVMEYKGAPGKPIVLIGKGVTFDTGGLNVKPGDSMNDMHMDMSGGAAVIHAIVLAAKLKLKKHIIALIPAVENMPSGESYRPGDILRSMSGKTIEVGNTDAEGRIILADAITYAKTLDPAEVIDAATLTGSAMAALGQRASAVLSKDEKLTRQIVEAGEKSGDYAWPLPLWDEFEEDIKGTFGDVSNTGKSKYGGAITAAMFLYQFAKELNCPWVHLDIASRMTTIEGEYLAKGASGVPVQLLTQFLRDKK